MWRAWRGRDGSAVAHEPGRPDGEQAPCVVGHGSEAKHDVRAPEVDGQ